MQETWVRFLGQEDGLEKKMAIYSSILAWEIPWTEESGGLQCMGLQSQTPLSDQHFDWRCVCVCVYIYIAAKSLQSCPTLCEGSP